MKLLDRQPPLGLKDVPAADLSKEPVYFRDPCHWMKATLRSQSNTGRTSEDEELDH